MTALELDLAFGFNPDALSTDVPGGLLILNQFALSGGKRFRPELLLKVAECLSLDSKTAIPFAIAAERIHNATLLHDDVVDEARARRGKPTLNATGENKKSILGGDLLLARTLRDLGVSGDAAIIRDMFDVLVELTEGEWLQLEARHQIDVGARHLKEVARKKTGSLIGWCCSTPARLKGESGESIEALREFGILLGVAFQLIDDCLDFSRHSGKPFAQDLREGQINFVVQDALEKSPELKPEIKAYLNSNATSYLPGDLSADFLKKISSSIFRVLDRAEVEIAFSREKLRQSLLAPPIQTRLEREILIPFTDQLLKTRASLK